MSISGFIKYAFGERSILHMDAVVQHQQHSYKEGFDSLLTRGDTNGLQGGPGPPCNLCGNVADSAQSVVLTMLDNINVCSTKTHESL